MPDGLTRHHRSRQSHFITFSCYRREPLLAQFHLELAFLQALEQVRFRFQMRVYGYVVMSEHVHILVSEPGTGLLSKTIEVLKTKVVIAGRKTAQLVGPLWLTRYFDHNVRNHAGFVTQLRYIHRNPVKRGLCSAPEDWPWSSFRAWAVGEVGPVEIECEWTARRREGLKQNGISVMKERELVGQALKDRNGS